MKRENMLKHSIKPHTMKDHRSAADKGGKNYVDAETL